MARMVGKRAREFSLACGCTACQDIRRKRDRRIAKRSERQEWKREVRSDG